MANYNSIEEIISAGTANMQVLRNNSSNDDGTDTYTGVDWFVFNNVVANNIYVSGNTWFGFGASSEQLKVNRRDAKVWYFWREEGTLYNYYRFLKMRWRGYSAYSSTSASYLLEYDVILWDTGDISLHMVNVPTSSNDGTYSLTEGTTYTYTVSTAAPDVTFKKTAAGREVINSLIDLRVPYDKRYLIRSNNVLYDATGAQLSVQTLDAETFGTYGSEEKPTTEVLFLFENPEILLWHDSTEYLPKLIATENATPPQQTLISGDYDMTDKTILGIEDADVIASDDVLFAVSFDSGATWKAYTGTAWAVLTSNDSGMSATTFNSIGVEEWAAAAVGAEHIRVRATLPALTSYIESVIINFIN